MSTGIVGAGIIGLAIGREITRRWPGTRVIVFDKENRVAAHQTGHNSGVVHAGIYYPPGSLKARLCTRGAVMLREYCADRGLPFEECGKLVVAVTPDEVTRLEALHARAVANAVPGLRRIAPEEIREIEPHATGLAALHSPRTAITDFGAIARSFAGDIVAAGGEVRLGFPVNRIGDLHGKVDRLIVCAGLQTDRVAGPARDVRIVPFRGEYLRVRAEKADLVRGLIYPVPDPRYPFLGVHYTRRVDGAVDVGPNAVLAWQNLWNTLSWPGFWRLAARHWRTGIAELHGSLSKRAFMRLAQRYVPEIGPKDVVRGPAGVRAQALDRDGGLVDDFRVNQLGPITTIRNAPSPAATSCLAIAEHVVAGWA